MFFEFYLREVYLITYSVKYNVIHLMGCERFTYNEQKQQCGAEY